MVTQFLANSQLPLETVAIAYNILASPRVTALHCGHVCPQDLAHQSIRKEMTDIHGLEADASCQRALVILVALSIAVSFSEDCPRSVLYWSRHVGQEAFSAGQIGAMSRVLLAHLDWQIHSLAAPGPVKAAMDALSPQTLKTSVLSPRAVCDESAFRLLISTHTATHHGLITPEASPDFSVMDAARKSYLCAA